MFWMVCDKCGSVERGRDPQKVPFHRMLQDQRERVCWGTNLAPRLVGRVQGA